MSIELSMNGDIITVMCGDKGELDMMSKDELEEYIYNNIGETVDISDEMMNELRKNGRLDIAITKETKTTVEQQPNSNINPFIESTSEAKETTSKSTVERAKYSFFISGNGKDAGTILMDLLDKEYIIWESKIERGKSRYIKTTELDSKGQIINVTKSTGIIRINLLEKIIEDVDLNSTGMDSREVRNYFIKKVDDEYHLVINCIFDDGDVTGKYRLWHIDKAMEKLHIF